MNRRTAIPAVIAAALAVVAFVLLLRAPEEPLVGLEPPSAGRGVGAAGAVGATAASPGSQGAATPSGSSPLAAAGREAAALDPRLARLRIEVQPDDASPAAEEGERDPRSALLSRIADDLRADAREGEALGLRGEMTVTFPRAVVSSTAQGASYAAGDEVTSRFTYVRDGRGNSCMREESRSRGGRSKYDGPAYNGSLCRIDGRYVHVDLAHHTAGDDELEAVLRERGGLRAEPFVLRTMRELVLEHGSLAHFDSAGDGGDERYTISALTGAPPDPTEVKRLAGDARFASPGGPLQAVSWSGELVLGSGYMKGAPLTFAVHVEVIPANELPPVRAQ